MYILIHLLTLLRKAEHSRNKSYNNDSIWRDYSSCTIYLDSSTQCSTHGPIPCPTSAFEIDREEFLTFVSPETIIDSVDKEDPVE